jgi:hypothetical protein
MIIRVDYPEEKIFVFQSSPITLPSKNSIRMI